MHPVSTQHKPSLHPQPVNHVIRVKGMQVICREGEGKQLRKSNGNEDIKSFYKKFLLHLLGHRSHELLHTSFE